MVTAKAEKLEIQLKEANIKNEFLLGRIAKLECETEEQKIIMDELEEKLNSAKEFEQYFDSANNLLRKIKDLIISYE